MQPHDAVFRWTFSQQRHAVGLLQATLPRAMVAATDWSTLRLENGSYVSQALRRRHCDLVFSVQMGSKTAYFYVLVEQQRCVEPLMIFRMGLYMMRLWEHLVRDHPDAKELPPIYPLLIHHSETGWTAATAFQDVVATGDAVRSELIGKLLEKAAGLEAREVIVTGLDRLERRGERKGEHKGQTKMLLGLLAVRFGSVPDEVSARVMAADEATLTRWAARVLTAPTLESVLDEDGAEASPARRRSASKRAR